MKTKIDLTSTVALDEISEQLIENLSVPELVKFVLSLGDDLDESEQYYHLLHTKTSDFESRR